MAISIHLDSRAFTDALERNKVEALAAARTIVEKGALIVASSAKRSFRPRPGGQRTSQKTGKIWYEFAPNFPATPPTPTSRSGALQTSVKMQKLVRVTGGWMSLVGTWLDYAPYVEYGTHFMAKEPFMEKAMDDNEVKIKELADAEWAKVVA